MGSRASTIYDEVVSQKIQEKRREVEPKTSRHDFEIKNMAIKVDCHECGVDGAATT